MDFQEAKVKGKMRDKYRIYEQIGQGSFGEVCKCMYKEHLDEYKSGE